MDIEYSDESEYWRAQRKAYKNRRDKRSNDNTRLLHALSVKYGLSKELFNANSWRLTKEGQKPLDYYPASKRAFSHKTKKWYNVKDLEFTITKHFEIQS